MYQFNELFHYKLYRSDLVIPGTKSSLYVEEILAFCTEPMREGYSTHLFVCVTYDSGGSADLQR